jgi:hypothetical protein
MVNKKNNPYIDNTDYNTLSIGALYQLKESLRSVIESLEWGNAPKYKVNRYRNEILLINSAINARVKAIEE